MKLLDVLSTDTICVDLQSRDKIGVLEELAGSAARVANCRPEALVKVLLERERLGSTGIGDGIGIPHGKLKEIDTLVIGFGRSRKGVNFDALDGRPVHLFFLIITPEESTGLHLKVLARISRMLRESDLRTRLMQVSCPEEVLTLIGDLDTDF